MAAEHGMYELMYVVNPVLNSEQTQDIVARVGEFVKTNGGDVVDTTEMGSQRLAYPIQKKKNGYYVVVYFRAPGDFIARLERALKINEDVIRHMVLRYDAKMERHFAHVQRDGLQPAIPLDTPAPQHADA